MKKEKIPGLLYPWMWIYGIIVLLAIGSITNTCNAQIVDTIYLHNNKENVDIIIKFEETYYSYNLIKENNKVIMHEKEYIKKNTNWVTVPITSDQLIPLYLYINDFYNGNNSLLGKRKINTCNTWTNEILKRSGIEIINIHRK